MQVDKVREASTEMVHRHTGMRICRFERVRAGRLCLSAKYKESAPLAKAFVETVMEVTHGL